MNRSTGEFEPIRWEWSLQAGSETLPQPAGGTPGLRGTAELHPKGAAFARFRIKSDAALHTFDSFAHDCQSDTRAGISLFGLEPLENSKYAVPVFFRNSDSVVSNKN